MNENGDIIDRLKHIKKQRMSILNNTQSFQTAKKVITKNFNTDIPDEMVSFKMGFKSKNYPEDFKKSKDKLLEFSREI